MKTDFRSIAIALVIFDIIYLSIVQYMIPSQSMPPIPNISNLFNFTYIYDTTLSFMGVPPSINIFGAVISFAPLFDVIAYPLTILGYIPQFLIMMFQFITYIYLLMYIPLNILPNVIKGIFILLFNVPVIISLALSIEFFATKIGGDSSG